MRMARCSRFLICALTASLGAGSPIARSASPSASACEATAATVPSEFSGVDVPAGRIDAAIAQVYALASGLMASKGIPGMAVAIVHNGKVVFAKGYGVRSVDKGVPVDADTVFQIASMSKSIGATVVAHQVGEGVVGWDTRVQKLMPAFKLADGYVTKSVTIGDLYAHRSGLPEHVADLFEDLGFDRAQMIEKLRYAPLKPFRISYAYTNYGLTAAAEAVAAASHTDWATLSQQVVYTPLGMASTSSRYADFLARPNRAVGHVLDGKKFVVTPSQRNPDAQSPAGGVSSSVNDIARWMNMVLAQGCANGAQLIKGDALLPAISPQIVSGAPSNPRSRAGFYGYGFNVANSGAGRVVLSHSGAFVLGAGTAFTLIPSAHVGIVTLTNALPVGVPETLNADFVDLVQFGRITQPWGDLYAGVFKQLIAPGGELACRQNADSGEFVCDPPPANAAPAQPLTHYAGKYASNYYGSAEIRAADKTLKLRIGPQGAVFELTHWDGDVFLMLPPGESANPGSRSMVTFAGNAMTIEYLNAEGLGVFRSTRAPRP